MLLAELQDERLLLKFLQGSHTRDLEAIDLFGGDEDIRRQAVQGTLHKMRTKSAVLALDLPSSKFLSRRLTFPEAAEDNLRQVVLYEMEHLTPFSPSEIYFELAVVGRDVDAGQIEVKLDVVPKKFVDRAISDLITLGFHPQRVGAAAEGLSASEGIDFLHSEELSRGSRAGAVFAGFLGIVSICLVLLAIYLPLERKQALSAQLSEEVTLLRKKANAFERLKSEIKDLQQRDRLIQQRKLHGALIISVLNAVTELLPDDTWLSQLKIKGNQVEIQGFAPMASALIGLIEESPNFRNPTINAPVRRDTKSDRDRFSITFDLAEGGA